MIGLAIIVAVCLFCFVGPLVYHTNQVVSNLATSNLPPGRAPARHRRRRLRHPRPADGQRPGSIEIGAAVAVLATIVGVIWGAITGYTGGLLDSTMMRIVD